MDLLIKCNVGPEERTYRALFGMAAGIGAFFSRKSGVRYALGALGLAGIGTGMSRYCPVYHMLGIRRCQPAYRSVAEMLRRI